MSDFFSNKAFLERLELLREARGLSKGDFCELVGTKNIFSRYAEPREGQKERKVKTPSVETLLNIAHEFNTSVDWLLTGRELGAPAAAPDAAELATLRAENKSLVEAAQQNVTIYGKTLATCSRLQEQNEVLRASLDRLDAESQTLRAQVSAGAMSLEEARLLAEVAEALGVPVERGFLGVLERVRANLASVGAISPPTANGSGSVQKSVGEGGESEENDVPPRANSSS